MRITLNEKLHLIFNDILLYCLEEHRNLFEINDFIILKTLN